MKIQLQKSNKFGGIFDFSKAFQIILEGKAKNTDLFLNYNEVLENTEAFEKTVFLSELLQFRSIVMIDSHVKVLPKALDLIYQRSIFSNLSRNIYSSADDVIETRSDSTESSHSNHDKIQGNLRTIIYWEGEDQLRPNLAFDIQFAHEREQAMAIQIQKIIFPDYSGSQFGINQLQKAQIGTVLLDVKPNFEYFTYLDKPDLGFFTIYLMEKLIGFGVCIK